MTETNTEKFLPDLARVLACAILTAVGLAAFGLGTVFLLNGAFHGAARADLVFFGAVALSGMILCAGAIFLDWKPPSMPGGPEQEIAHEVHE